MGCDYIYVNELAIAVGKLEAFRAMLSAGEWPIESYDWWWELSGDKCQMRFAEEGRWNDEQEDFLKTLAPFVTEPGYVVVEYDSAHERLVYLLVDGQIEIAREKFAFIKDQPRSARMAALLADVNGEDPPCESKTE